MAYRVEITDRALRDLASIYERIEAETTARAARWFDGLEKAVNGLEKRPHRAPVTPEDVEDIVVSKDVDEFWHTHILHTMKYTEDCERVFGTYLHHNPDIGERTPVEIQRKAVLVKKTRRLYQRESAMCSAAIQAENAAMCSAAIQVTSPARALPMVA